MLIRGVKTIIKPIVHSLVVVIGILLAGQIQAATLYLSPSFGSGSVGKTFSVSVYVASKDEAINAASGVVSFPADKLEILSVSKSSSVFNLWVAEPSFSQSGGNFTFEGIVLNPGYTGAGGKIISASFKVKSAGTAKLSFSSGAILANDGEGTNILTGFGSATFNLVDDNAPKPVTPITPPVEIIKPITPIVETPKLTTPTTPEQPEPPNSSATSPVVASASTTEDNLTTPPEITGGKNLALTSWPERIKVGATLTIKGKTSGLNKVMVYWQKGNETAVANEVLSDLNGNFSFITKVMEAGNYRAWAEVKDAQGLLAINSDKVNIVVYDGIIKVIFNIFKQLWWLLIVLAVGALVYAYFKSPLAPGSHQHRKHLDRLLYNSLLLLRDGIKDQIKILMGAKARRRLNKEEIMVMDGLKKTLSNTDRFLAKEITIIKKRRQIKRKVNR